MVKRFSSKAVCDPVSREIEPPAAAKLGLTIQVATVLHRRIDETSPVVPRQPSRCIRILVSAFGKPESTTAGKDRLV
jgi:hypothetical protein